MSREAEASLVNIVYERKNSRSGSYYEIFWYHWPRDGVFPWEDFEPIVFAYNEKQKLCFVLIRRGWKMIFMNPEDVSWPPEILFKGSTHHQFVRMTVDPFGELDQSNLTELETVNVTFSRLTLINSSNNSYIPSWNISGLGESIYERIRKAMLELCER